MDSTYNENCSPRYDQSAQKQSRAHLPDNHRHRRLEDHVGYKENEDHDRLSLVSNYIS